MSKTAQRKQSAFSVGYKIGLAMSGTYTPSSFNRAFRRLNRHRTHGRIVYIAAVLGHNARLKRISEAAESKSLFTHLTGG